jgi:UDP-glucose 4-epimerase
MRVLVTGASGFSGSTVARELAPICSELVALHRNDSRFLAILHGVPAIRTLRSDLAQAASLPGPFDAVVHAAATSPAPGIDVARMVHDNVAGTAALIEAAERWRCSAFVLFSSLSIYGEVTVPVLDEATPIVNPDAYGATKHLGELMLATRSDRLPGIALRLPGVLGPGAHRNWMSRVAATLLAGGRVSAFHLDRPYNNAVHIGDVAALIAHLLARPWHGFDAVVLGARGSMPVRDAIERLAAGLGVRAQIEETPPDKASFMLSSERAMASWGYRPMEIGALLDRYAAEVRRGLTYVEPEIRQYRHNEKQ